MPTVPKPEPRGAGPALQRLAVAGRLGPKPDAVVDAQRPAFDLLVRVLSGNGKPAHSIFEDPVSLSANRTGVTMNGPLNLASTLSEDFLLGMRTA